MIIYIYIHLQHKYVCITYIDKAQSFWASG